MSFETIWNKFWRDNDGRGKVVIWQMPNWWLIAWAALTFVGLFFSGKVADVFTWLASAALLLWSVLEITKGVNYFRRLLGAVVLIYCLMTLIKSL